MNFIYRIFKSGCGIKPFVNWLKNRFKVITLVKQAPKRTGDVLINNVNELNVLMEGHAYLQNSEIPLLARYARLATKTIVEIGAAYGASSSIFLLHSNKDTGVYSIDPFITDSMTPFRATKEKCEKNVRRILSTFKKLNRLSSWHLITDYSYNVSKKWKKPIDMIFIDGDHHYEAVKRDFEDWVPHVRSGGFVLFHDSCKLEATPAHTFNRGWPGPTKLCHELRSDNRVSYAGEVFSITAWQKK